MDPSSPPGEPSLPSSSYDALALLVDDQPMVAEAVRRSLARQDDIRFHYCSDPLEAVALAIRIKPSVMLLDLVMPQMDGLTLVRRFRDNPETSQTPIIMLSAREDPQVKSDAFSAGANDYLVKLPDAIELRARVRYHSQAHLNRVQRDEAFQALHESQQQLIRKNGELFRANQELEAFLVQVKQLQGLLPICYCCKKIRDDQNYWHQIDAYLTEHSAARFSHGLCPDCYVRERQRIRGGTSDTLQAA